MRVALFQMDIAWLDQGKNLKKIKNQCEKIRGKADLLVLPEMFSVGYVLKTSLLNPDWQHEVLRTLVGLCHDNHLIITGSIPFFNQGRWTNTMITVNETGLIHQYDKIHLFSPAGESLEYSRGQLATSWAVQNWIILPLVCYDLRFPYLSFSKELPHLLIYSANWPEARIRHWDTLLQARAIENQCYVIGVNRVGIDENGYVYPGHSAIYDFEGKQISFAEKKEGHILADLGLSDLSIYREKLPFFSDRRELI